MKTKVRPVIFLIGAAGFVCLGYAFAFAVKNGLALSWDGNWDPVVIGLVGVATLAAAATMDAVLKRRNGLVNRKAIPRDIARTLAVTLLAFMQFAGVFLAMWAFVLFLAFARAGQDASVAIVATLVGVAANRVAALLLPSVRPVRPKKETFVSAAEDDDAT